VTAADCSSWGCRCAPLTRSIIVIAIGLLAGCVARCSSTPAPGVPSFAGPASPSASAACSTLALLGCAEGQDPQCPLVIDRRNLAKILPVDVAAMTNATTKAQARTAGVNCP
jgi:hypothetical protein